MKKHRCSYEAHVRLKRSSNDTEDDWKSLVLKEISYDLSSDIQGTDIISLLPPSAKGNARRSDKIISRGVWECGSFFSRVAFVISYQGRDSRANMHCATTMPEHRCW